jgi:DNA replication and repair protein RecF
LQKTLREKGILMGPALPMGLSYLDITNFRNLISVRLNPILQGFNVIYGNNGSGKTSLLEAIYYMSLGRSFRSTIVDRIVHRVADRFSLFSHFSSIADHIVPLGLERHQNGNIKIRINEQDAHSIAELAVFLPVQLMDTHCYKMLDGGPLFRRKYLDGGVFYFNPDFLRIWREFNRVLKQRNAALRAKVSYNELKVWSDELIQYAKKIHFLRKEYLDCLRPLLMDKVSTLLDISHVQVDYQPGWNQEQSYEEVIAQTLSKDYQLGYTQSGPHKADLSITMNQVPLKDILSRGQQKLSVCAMIIARGAVLLSHVNKRPIYLVDDLPSELDLTSRSRLVTLLSKQDAQLFVTGVERESWEELLKETLLPRKMFHVEHGCLTEIPLSI